MTTGVRWSPWAELRRYPDIWVHRCRLSEGLGWWCPGERMILVDERLDGCQTRCVVAHELGHAVLGHGWSPDFADVDWLARRQERQADQWAARRLVTVDALAEALVAHPDDRAAAACFLDVTVDVLADRLAAVDDAERAVIRARCAALESAA